MRSAEDFNLYYATPDPWGLAGLSFRDRLLRRFLAEYVAGKSVLELGCGEGHLTRTIFFDAKAVRGVDISDVAIARARDMSPPNASCEAADLIDIDFNGFGVLTAIECIYYLAPAEREVFFEKVRREHKGGAFVISAPIIGELNGHSYFTDREIVSALHRHGMTIIERHNLMPRWDGFPRRMASAMIRHLPFGDRLLSLLPNALVYQRLYIAFV